MIRLRSRDGRLPGQSGRAAMHIKQQRRGNGAPARRIGPPPLRSPSPGELSPPRGVKGTPRSPEGVESRGGPPLRGVPSALRLPKPPAASFPEPPGGGFWGSPGGNPFLEAPLAGRGSQPGCSRWGAGLLALWMSHSGVQPRGEGGGGFAPSLSLPLARGFPRDFGQS